MPFTLEKLQESLGYSSAPGQKIMCKLTCIAYFQREGAQPASRLWEEVLLQRVMGDVYLGWRSGSLFKLKHTLNVFCLWRGHLNVRTTYCHLAFNFLSTSKKLQTERSIQT